MKIVLKILKISLFFFIFFASNYRIFSQIPVNGFLNFNSIQIPSGYSYFTPIDFNNDNYSDLLIFGNQNYASLKGYENTFGKPSVRKIPYSVTFVKFVYEQNNTKYYIALARKSRTAFLFFVSQEGIINITRKTEFSDYPSYVEVSPFDDNGTKKLLVCGENFNGITFLYLNKNGSFKQKKVIKSGIYKSANFIDLDYDQAPDIVANNKVDNSLDFFYNNSKDEFRKERSTFFDNAIFYHNLCSFNDDGFEDLVLLKENGCEILFGDSVYSFHNKFFINSNNLTENYVYDDFNNSGLNDFAYVGRNDNSLNVLYRTKDDSIGHSVCYTKNIKIIHLASIKDTTGINLFALTSKNQILKINKLNNISDGTKFSFGMGLGVIGSFYYNNNANGGLYFVNNDNMTLNLLTSTKNYFFKNLYQVKLSEIPDKIKVYASDKNYFFILQKSETPFCEIVVYNFVNNAYRKHKIFNNLPIHDFSINKIDGEITLTLLTKYNGKLKYIRFILNDNSFEEDESEEVNDRVFDAKINPYNANDIFYWKLHNNKTHFNFYRYNIATDINKIISTVFVNEGEQITVNSVMFRNKKHPRYVSLVNSDSSYYLCSFNYQNGVSNVIDVSKENEFKLNDFSLKNKLVSDNNFLFINNSKNNNLVKISVNDKPSFEGKITIPLTENYFIGIYNNKKFIVFTEANKNIINFKELGN